jgi:hypothetical protein
MRGKITSSVRWKVLEINWKTAVITKHGIALSCEIEGRSPPPKWCIIDTKETQRCNLLMINDL